MGRKTTSAKNINASSKAPKIDRLDLELIPLLVNGLDSQDIAAKLDKPLSTVQRRKRILFDKGLLENRTIPNYKKLGFKRGLLHVYVSNGEAEAIGEKLATLKGIISASLHIGNSDLVGEFVYRDSMEILDLISSVKKINGVENTVWSEEVLEISRSVNSAPFMPNA